MVTLTRLPIFFAAAVLLASCASGPKVSADPPSGEKDLVLRMTELPGMLPPGGGLTPPTVSIFGGGLAVLATPQGLVERKLTPAGVRKVTQAAADAGLTGSVERAAADGPDAGSVTFVVVSGGTRQVNLIASPKGKVADLVGNLKDLDSFLGSDIAPQTAPYQHTRLAVWAQPQETSAAAAQWELADLATAGEPYETGRCQVVTGDDIGKLATAKTGNHWRSKDAVYYVILRPMLPDEENCPRVESLAAS